MAPPAKDASSSWTQEVTVAVDYMAELRQMLSVLGRYLQPVYSSQQYHFQGDACDGVTCQLTLSPINNGDQPPRIFRERRNRSEEGFQETARAAMLGLTRIHAAGTAYRLYPSLDRLRLTPPQRCFRDEEDAAVRQLARFALTQARFAERTADELRRAHQDLDGAWRTIFDLLEALLREANSSTRCRCPCGRGCGGSGE